MQYTNQPVCDKNIVRSLDKIAQTEHGGNDEGQDYAIMEIAGKIQGGYELVRCGKKRHVEQVNTV